MKNFIFFCCIVATAVAFPAPQNLPLPALQVKNVIDVPIVCPPNQKPDQYGRCREVWRFARLIIFFVPMARYQIYVDCPIDIDVNNKNVIDAPVVCPVGQKPDQNGKCEWSMRTASENTVQNVIDAPVVCPAGQKPDQNGKCREVWTLNDVDDRNVIDVPVVCPVGQKPDQNGKCRDVYTARAGVDTQNVIDAPIVCPPNQKPDQNGKCREQWNLNGMKLVPGLEID